VNYDASNWAIASIFSVFCDIYVVLLQIYNKMNLIY
jgi:hypothetical protein